MDKRTHGRMNTHIGLKIHNRGYHYSIFNKESPSPESLRQQPHYSTSITFIILQRRRRHGSASAEVPRQTRRSWRRCVQSFTSESSRTKLTLMLVLESFVDAEGPQRTRRRRGARTNRTVEAERTFKGVDGTATRAVGAGEWCGKWWHVVVSCGMVWWNVVGHGTV